MDFEGSLERMRTTPEPKIKLHVYAKLKTADHVDKGIAEQKQSNWISGIFFFLERCFFCLLKDGRRFDEYIFLLFDSYDVIFQYVTVMFPITTSPNPCHHNIRKYSNFYRKVIKIIQNYCKNIVTLSLQLPTRKKKAHYLSIVIP